MLDDNKGEHNFLFAPPPFGGDLLKVMNKYYRKIHDISHTKRKHLQLNELQVSRKYELYASYKCFFLFLIPHLILTCYAHCDET